MKFVCGLTPAGGRRRRLFYQGCSFADIRDGKNNQRRVRTRFGAAVEMVDVYARVAKFLSGAGQFSRSMSKFHLDNVCLRVAHAFAVKYTSCFCGIVEHQPRHALSTGGKRLRSDDVHVAVG